MSSRKNFLFCLIALGVHIILAGIFFYMLSIRSNTTRISTRTMPAMLAEIKTATETFISTKELPHTLGNQLIATTDAILPFALETHYLPASQLDVRPLVIIDIDPDLLDNFRGVEAQSLDFVLLINEYGDVDQVIFDAWSNSLNLPDSLLNDLKQRFMQARFFPGKIKNQSVASELRIRIHLE